MYIGNYKIKIIKIKPKNQVWVTLKICCQSSESEPIAALFILIMFSSHLILPLNEQVFSQCSQVAYAQLFCMVCLRVIGGRPIKNNQYKCVKFIRVSIKLWHKR